MSESQHHGESDEWLDEQLRNVALPEGFLERLRAMGPLDDAQLDALLREVPVPTGLVQQLKMIPDDELVDQHLCDVPVPDGLLARLRSVTSEPELETADAVAVAAGDVGSASWTARLRFDSPVGQFVLAASILIAVGLAGMWAVDGGFNGETTTVAINGDDAVEDGRDVDAPPVMPTQTTTSDAEVVVKNSSEDAGGNTDVAGSAIGDPVAPLLARDPTVADTFPSPLVDSTPVDRNSDAEWVADDEFIKTLQPLEPGDRSIVGYGAIRQTAQPEPVPRIVSRGVSPPAAKEFDRLQLVQDGIHPFVLPSANEILESVAVPLATETTSFDNLRWRLARRLPTVETIRPEDFLAAMDYDFAPPATGALAVMAAGGPSPFGERNLKVLQVAVQATDRVDRRAPATHVLVGVDVSVGEQRTERLNTLRRGLVQWFSKLGPEDQVTLVALHEDAELLIDRAGADQAEAWRAAVDRLRPTASRDFGAGLDALANLASRANRTKLRQQVVLFARRPVYASEAELVEYERLIGAATDGRTRWDAFDLSGGDDSDPNLERLALAGRGAVRRVDSPRAVAQSMREVVLGRSSVVATEARLTVRFNPDVVKRYRLIGHEADAIGGLVSGPLEASFRMGDASTALFEVELNKGGGDEVARATIYWRDAQTQREVRRQRRVTRGDFARNMADAPVSLQQAAVAGAAAEVLRESPYVRSDMGGLAGVVRFGRDLAETMPAHHSFHAFLDVVEQAPRRGQGPR